MFPIFGIALQEKQEFHTQMMLLWSIFLLCFVTACQTADPNCLRDNLGALDAEFTFRNRYENHTDVNPGDFTNHVLLFTTRFKRAHQFTHFNDEHMELLKRGISLLPDASKNKLELFLTVPNFPPSNNLTRATNEYIETYDSVMKVNSGKEGPVVGLYIKGLMKTWNGTFKAVEAAFGTKQNSSVAIGQAFLDCAVYFKNLKARSYLQRLNFITCDIPVLSKRSAEESADYVIMACNKIRDDAVSIQVTATIRCRVGYPSYGVSPKGVVGTLLNFQKFWCRIDDKVTRDSAHAPIIMKSAFDNTPKNYKANSTDLNAGKYYGGWWRRRVITSYEKEAFIEKVEELKSSGENPRCTEECSVCNSNDQCCEGRTCIIDTSFQPFENDVEAHVCQSSSTRCAPRFTGTPATRSTMALTTRSSMALTTRSSIAPTKTPKARSVETSPPAEMTPFPITETNTEHPILHSSKQNYETTSLESGQSVVVTFNRVLMVIVSIITLLIFDLDFPL